MAYCPECGSEVGEGEKFCSDCGNSLGDNSGERNILQETTGEAAGDGGVTDSIGNEFSQTNEPVNATGNEIAGDDSLRTAIQSGNISVLSTRLLAVSAVMGLLVGLVVTFAFTNVGGGIFWFLITIVGVTYYLYERKSSLREAVGSGMFILALWMPITPIIYYITALGGVDTDTAAGTGAAIGSVFGMFLYGFIGLIIGIVLAAIGYFVKE